MQIKIENNSIILSNEKTSIAMLIFFGIPSLVLTIVMGYIGVLGFLNPKSSLIGLLFCSLSFLGLWVIKTMLLATAPTKWIFAPSPSKSITATFKILGVQIKKFTIDKNYRIFASPAYQRGDWGYCLGILSPEGKKQYLSPATLVSDKIEIAKQKAKDIAVGIANKLKFDSVMLGWEKYEKTA